MAEDVLAPLIRKPDGSSLEVPENLHRLYEVLEPESVKP